MQFWVTRYAAELLLTSLLSGGKPPQPQDFGLLIGLPVAGHCWWSPIPIPVGPGNS